MYYIPDSHESEMRDFGLLRIIRICLWVDGSNLTRGSAFQTIAHVMRSCFFYQ